MAERRGKFSVLMGCSSSSQIRAVQGKGGVASSQKLRPFFVASSIGLIVASLFEFLIYELTGILESKEALVMKGFFFSKAPGEQSYIGVDIKCAPKINTMGPASRFYYVSLCRKVVEPQAPILDLAGAD